MRRQTSIYDANITRLALFWPYGMLFFVILIFYWDIAVVKGAWLVGDHAEQHFPWAMYLARSLRQGHIPLWTDLIHTGFPITAEGQIGSFYPLNLLFYLLFPIRVGYAWNIIFHFVVSSFLMFRFMRRFDLDNRSAFFGTFVYLFASTLGGAYYNITSLKVLAWFPGVLILMDQMVEDARIKIKRIVGLGVLLAFQLLAGYLQFAVFSFFISAIYLVLRTFETWRFKLKPIAVVLINGLGALIIAVMLALPQLFLTYELAIRSNRANPEESFAYVGSYSPFNLICLLFPSMEGFFISKLYLGVFPLFFIFAAIFSYRFFRIKSIYWMVMIAFLLALGRWSPVYVALIKGLHFYSFRTPMKFVFFAGFFMSILCAFGMKRILEDSATKEIRRGFKTFIVFSSVLCAGVVVSFFLFRFYEKNLYTLGEWLVARFIYGTAGHPFPWGHYEKRLHDFIAHAQWVLDPRQKVVTLPLLKIVASVAVICALIQRRLRGFGFYLASILLVISDLNLSYSDIRGDYARYDVFFQKNPTVRFLEKNLNGARYFNYSVNPSEAPLPASKNMAWGLATVNAYSPLVVKDYYEFFDAMGGINDSLGFLPVSDEFLIANLKLLAMLHVKYIVTDRVLLSTQLVEVFQDASWRVYENRLFTENGNGLVKNYEIETDVKNIFSKIRKNDFDINGVVILESVPSEFYGSENQAVEKEGVVALSDEAENKIFEVQTQQPSVFVLPLLYYPGWRAIVDERPTQIFRANGVLMGIPLKPGRHKIHLSYEPFRVS